MKANILWIGLCIGCLAAGWLTLGSLQAAADQAGQRIFLTDFPRLSDEQDDGPRIQRAINSASFGDTVILPKGNYTVSSKMGNIYLKDGVSLLGVQATITAMTRDDPAHAYTDIHNIFYGYNVSKLSIEGLRFKTSAFDKPRAMWLDDGKTRRNGTGSNWIALHFAAASDIYIRNCRGAGFEVFMKFSGHRLAGSREMAWNERIRIEHLSVTATHQPFYAGYTRDLTLTDSELICPPADETDSLDHQIYVSSNTRDIRMSKLRLEGGGGYAVQVQTISDSELNYNVSMRELELRNVTRGLVVHSQSPGAVNTGIRFEDVTINGVDAKALTVIGSGHTQVDVNNLYIQNFGGRKAPLQPTEANNPQRELEALFHLNASKDITVNNVTIDNCSQFPRQGVIHKKSYSAEQMEYRSCGASDT